MTLIDVRHGIGANLALALAVFFGPAVTALGETMHLGDFSFSPGFSSSHFDTVYDLTQVDLTISYQIDLSETTKVGPDLGPFVEVGLREVGAADLNPGVFGVQPGGKGGWMISAVGDLATSDTAFEVDDKHNLQSAGDLDETRYDAIDRSTITAPFGLLGTSTGILFDRDGVGFGEDSQFANTRGLYSIEVDFHAINSQQATMFATVNGLTQGFAPGVNGSINPAGASFTGDMTQMQVFLGAIMDDGTGIIRVNDLTVTTRPIPVPEPRCSVLACVAASLWLVSRSRRA